MASEGPYRHPGGRICAGAMLALTAWIVAGTGFWMGIIWAVYH